MKNKKNPECFLKYSRKKNKNIKVICVVLDYSKPKIFFVGQPWWPTLTPQLFHCCYGPGLLSLKSPPHQLVSEAATRGVYIKKGSFFINISRGRKHATLLKNGLWYRCFPVNFVKLLRTPYLQNTSRRLLLKLRENRTIAYIKSRKNYLFHYCSYGCIEVGI